jgi:hypothetical protein
VQPSRVETVSLSLIIKKTHAGSGSGTPFKVGSGTPFKVGSGSDAEKNHSGSTTRHKKKPAKSIMEADLDDLHVGAEEEQIGGGGNPVVVNVVAPGPALPHLRALQAVCFHHLNTT